MGRQIIEDVPRYYEPYVNDCFASAYGALIQHVGHNPNLVLADYMSFMFDAENGYIGVNFLHRYSTSVEFSEEQLNSSLAAVYFPATAHYDRAVRLQIPPQQENKLVLRMYIHDDPEVAEQRLREMVDAGRPIVVFIDLYHMHYHQAYQREHGLHAVVITGYDDEAQQYHMFDKYIMTNCDFDGAISMEEVRVGRLSHCPMHNPMSGDFQREIRHLWVEISGEDTFVMTDELISTVLQESRNRMLGHERVHGNLCGFPAIEAFRQYLQQMDLSALDEKMIYRFRGYYLQALKQVARQRRRFAAFISEIPGKLLPYSSDSICEDLHESAKYWDISANLALKFGITKRMKLVEDIVDQLVLLEQLERGIMNKIGDPAGVIM